MIVDRGRDRTNHLARGILAMHAGHGHVREGGSLGTAPVVGVDPDPMHVTPAGDLLFAHNGNVVLRLTREQAGVAPEARAQIDRHPPLVIAIRELIWTI